MIRFSPIGHALIITLVLWPLIITIVFWVFRTSFKKEFFISSLISGFIVYYTPVILHHAGALDHFEQRIQDFLEVGKLLFPLLTTIFWAVFWGKVIKPK